MSWVKFYSREVSMKPSNVVARLSLLVALLGLLAAGAGLFWPVNGSPFTVATVRGEEVVWYGRGLAMASTVTIPHRCRF
jgi:hypothetical protein